ncbi:hypothetical protein TWF281_011057 [Arthrobotrys megalospora]
MSETTKPDHEPFSKQTLNEKLQARPREYWEWLQNLDWEKIRHAPRKHDVREEFADTLVYHEVLRELNAFLGNDLKKKWPAILKAIQQAFGESASLGWAQQFIDWYLRNKQFLENPDQQSEPEMIETLASMPLPDLKYIDKQYGKINVGIIGGGVSGLYAGRLFDWLNQHLSAHPRSGGPKNENLEFEFKILEAANRVGGRIYTHHFSPGNHDYYDVGAMRFPDTEIMKRTSDPFADVGLFRTEQEVVAAKSKSCETYFNDIQHHKVKHEEAHLQETKKKKEARLNMKSEEQDVEKLKSYAEIREAVKRARKAAKNPNQDSDSSKDIFFISTKNYGDVPYAYIELGAENLLEYAFGPFKYLMKYNFYVGYQALMRYEEYSVREFLSKICKFDFYTINWLETLDSATGWFNLALSEAVLESFTFNSPQVYLNPDENGHEHNHEISPKAQWYCVEGGTGEVIRRLNDKVSGEPEYNRVVIGMKLNKDAPENEKMEVYLKDSHEPRKYHSVINTTTLGCAARMDLKNVGLQTGQKSAIRMLRYSASTKIGVKFTDPWWTQKPFVINEGGVASSDLYSARMCVYPSYNINDPPNRPAVLLASYCWGQDAERVGSMIKKTSPDGEEVLRDCLLRDLARLHHDPKAPPERNMGYDYVLAMIRTKYITHHAYDWNHDSFVSGAFAMFGPGQYRKMMPHLQRPAAEGRLHFVGEATSNHHAWIVGALESSLRAVCHILIKIGHWDLVDKIFEEWEKLPGYNKNIFFWQHVLGLLPPSDQRTGQEFAKDVPANI